MLLASQDLFVYLFTIHHNELLSLATMELTFTLYIFVTFSFRPLFWSDTEYVGHCVEFESFRLAQNCLIYYLVQ